MLAYNIVDWGEAPGERRARVVPKGARERWARRQKIFLDGICGELDERPDPRVRRAIGYIAWRLGREGLAKLIAEARAIHDGPGMLVKNGSRQRTLGGVFFQLAELAVRRRRGEAEDSADASTGQQTMRGDGRMR